VLTLNIREERLFLRERYQNVLRIFPVWYHFACIAINHPLPKKYYGSSIVMVSDDDKTTVVNIVGDTKKLKLSYKTKTGIVQNSYNFYERFGSTSNIDY